MVEDMGKGQSFYSIQSHKRVADVQTLVLELMTWASKDDSLISGFEETKKAAYKIF